MAFALQDQHQLEQVSPVLQKDGSTEHIGGGAKGTDDHHGFLLIKLLDEGQDCLCDELLDVELDHAVFGTGRKWIQPLFGRYLSLGLELPSERFLYNARAVPADSREC